MILSRPFVPLQPAVSLKGQFGPNGALYDGELHGAIINTDASVWAQH